MGEPTWRVVGASVRGTSHRDRDLPCQDAHAARVLPDGTLVIAVADGAGSAPRSDEGARLAVECAASALELAAQSLPTDDDGWRMLMLDVFREARRAIDEAAGEGAGAVGDFASTLICTLAGHDWLVAAQVGDGAVVVEDAGGTLALALAPTRGEYANTTTFLTMSDAFRQLDIVHVSGPLRSVAVTTDGLLRLALNLAEQAPHAPFFRPILAFAAEAEETGQAEAELTAFLSSDRVNARTEDDKTLVLAVHRSSDNIEAPAVPEENRSSPTGEPSEGGDR